MANQIVNSLPKIISLILVIFSTSSCAFLNLKTTPVTINSEPGGAKIYIDDIYIGTTPKEIDVVPDKKPHNLRLVKDGYKTATMNMETKLSLRKNQAGYSKCKMDLINSVFILPIFGLTSVYCRDFTQRVYDAELVLLPTQQFSPEPAPQAPFSSRSYYLPPSISQGINQRIQSIDNQTINQNMAAPPQPIFNNQSEYINNGNEPEVRQNFNYKDKVDYYNWQ